MNIKIGDRLLSEYGHEVIVYIDTNGTLSGKLVCDKGHPCENIPYSLDGKYTKVSKCLQCKHYRGKCFLSTKKMWECINKESK